MGRLMKVNWPSPITLGECQRVLDLMHDPDPAIADEGYRQFFDHYLAGRLPVDRLSAKQQRSLREIVDKVTGRSVH